MPPAHPKPRFHRVPRQPWAAYAVLGGLLVAYLVSLVMRSDRQESTLVDGWLVAVFELIAAGLCLVRAMGPRRGRALPLVLGAALFAWAMGDVLLTVESSGGATPPVPSPADIFYLGFYPLMYVALGLLMRTEVRRLTATSWLDGLVAGLGAAGLSACFAFSTIARTAGGDSAGVAVNLAYPIGDLLLLLLVFGGSAALPGRRGAQWMVIAGACALNAVGDTFNLFQASLGDSHVAIVINGIAWPTSLLLLSFTAWLRTPRADPLASDRGSGFLLPGLGACAGLAILFVGTVEHVSAVAVGLAMATLLTVGVRFGLSLRRLRSLTDTRQQQAVTDELTGLGNRRQLFALLDGFFSDAADERTPLRQLAFLFVDLDHFKEINDSFGHSAGDHLLRQLGPRLQGALRSTDLLVRIGGDELGVVVMDTDPAYAQSVAERMTDRLRQPFVLGEVLVRVSASIGIAVAPDDAQDAASLLRCADLAMYRAKLTASPYEVYRRDLDDGGNRLRLVEELRVAVETDAFDLAFQSQLDLRSTEVTAVEALLRWNHPRLGQVGPLEFLPLAEEAGLMQRITALVLDRALAQCADWRREGRTVVVGVNVSVSDLLDPRFVEMVTAALERHDLPPSALTLEITETTIIHDFDICQRVIAELRRLGAGVAIDDFGAGFTSLAYLGSLAVSELKLDRSFITGLASEARGRDLALVRATVELGHALGLRVVAEGIEDATTMELLAQVGCDVGQGFFIGRPAPAEHVVFPGARRVLALPRSVA